MLVAVETGFSVLIEAKVLSDISNQVSFDPLRNQLTRLLDVMLEPASSTYAPLKDRKQDRSVAVLLTPRLFKDNPMFETVRHPSGLTYPAPGAMGTIPQDARRPVQPAPRLGQHTDQVLAEVLGLSSGEIGRLHDQGLVAQAS